MKTICERAERCNSVIICYTTILSTMARGSKSRYRPFLCTRIFKNALFQLVYIGFFSHFFDIERLG